MVVILIYSSTNKKEIKCGGTLAAHSIYFLKSMTHPDPTIILSLMPCSSRWDLYYSVTPDPSCMGLISSFSTSTYLQIIGIDTTALERGVGFNWT